MKTIYLNGFTYQMVLRHTVNLYDCGTEGFGIEFLPTNGRSYISNEWKWFNTEAERAAFIQAAN